MGLHRQLSGHLEETGGEGGHQQQPASRCCSVFLFLPRMPPFLCCLNGEIPSREKVPTSPRFHADMDPEVLEAPPPTLRGPSSGSSWESCRPPSQTYQRKVPGMCLSPSAAHVKPNSREGCCAGPKSSGVLHPQRAKS